MEVITGIKIHKIVAPGIILQMGLGIISCRLVMKIFIDGAKTMVKTCAHGYANQRFR